MNSLPLTASNLYAKNLFSFIRNLYSKEKKGFNINLEDEIIEKSLIKISSVIIVGAIIAALANISDSVFTISSIFGFIAIVLAAINIFGGFLVTQRMLQMYKKKKDKKK